MNDLSDLSTAGELAQRTADAMWPRDRVARLLGMRLVEVAPGRASLEMTIGDDMVNAFGICHGGMIFALADTAFAYASNTEDQITVASACHVDFIAPGRVGQTLRAEACERSRSGRTGVYDVTVQTVDGATVALFRGKSHRLQGEVTATLAATAQG